MIALFHFLRLALHNLLRGGQRILVAWLCITFGIMALVAMSMLAKSIESVVVMEPAQQIGGDLSIGRQAEDAISAQAADQLAALQGSGAISRYTLIAFNNSSLVFHTPGSGEVHFIANGMGIEPEKYPLAGRLLIGEPAGARLTALLGEVGDVVITRDLAEEYRLQVGDALVLADLRSGSPLPAVLRAIAYDTPNHQGGKMYYSIATAERLAGGKGAVNTAILSAPQPEALSAQLESSGWSVDWSVDRRSDQTSNAWMLGLRGAGILGLLIGGTGIANTMQVLLRRRQKEIAIWKTLGYQESDLRLIFALEVGLLGLAGSLPGAGLGVLLSSGMLELFRQTSTLLYQWTFSPTPLLLGILVGGLSTVLFAAWAIVVSCQASPVALLREETPAVRALTGWRASLLGLLLAVLFTALTGLIMDSLLAGLIVFACIALGLGLLGGAFSLALSLGMRILPLRHIPLAGLALNGLRRRRPALVFAMIALFCGSLAMSAGMLVNLRVQSAEAPQDAEAPQAREARSYQLEILADADQEQAARQAIQARSPARMAAGYRVALESLSLAGETKPLPATDPVLVGRADPQDYVLYGAAWGSQPDSVYVPRSSGLKPGERVEVRLRGGASRTFRVAGSYEVNYQALAIYPPQGLLIAAEGFTRAAQADSLAYFLEVSPGQTKQAASELVTALPHATVIDLEAYAGRFMLAYQRLYALPLLVAGLAVLAGLLLVANSVSLALLDRRHEIGVLKTLGYARRQILALFGVEYGMVGLLAALAALLAAAGLVALVSLASQSGLAVLALTLPTLFFVTLCVSGMTLLTVLGVAWNPTCVPPLAVLNEGN